MTRPASPGCPSARRVATSRATVAWKASGGTAAMSTTVNRAASSENSGGSRMRASASWKTAFSPLAVPTATARTTPEPISARLPRGALSITAGTRSAYER